MGSQRIALRPADTPTSSVVVLLLSVRTLDHAEFVTVWSGHHDIAPARDNSLIVGASRMMEVASLRPDPPNTSPVDRPSSGPSGVRGASRQPAARWPPKLAPMLLTAFGAAAVSFMVVTYALERRHRGFVLAFAAGCLLSSAYGFLVGAWPFGVVEIVWSGIAVRRYLAAPTPTRSGD